MSSISARSESGQRSRRPTKRTRTPCRSRSGNSRSIVSAKSVIRSSTSRSGRPQFSVEKAYTARLRTPSPGAASTVRRSARVPARCPASGGSPRRAAQRPFPSMMMATLAAVAGASGSGVGPARRSRPMVRSSRNCRRTTVIRPDADPSDFHDLGLFGLQRGVDLGDALVGQLLQPVLRPVDVVRAGLAVLLEVLEPVDGVAADVAGGDPALLGHVPHLADEVLAPLLGELRDREPDQLAVVRRREAEVGLEDAALDVLHDALVERRDREHARLGDADRGQLVDRHLGAVGGHLDAVEQGRRRPPRPHGHELVPGALDALVHPAGGILQHVIDHVATSAGMRAAMIVPTRSPRTTRSMFDSSSRLKTYSGTRLSMHSDSAVVSMTFRPRSIASRWVSSGIRRASGFSRGSESSTPSTPFLPIRMPCAPISSARRAAAVSVVKNGLPVPAAKITTRPFSRWRIARRRMYGSATWDTLIADCTRVCTPSCSSASEIVSAFRSVASIPA